VAVEHKPPKQATAIQRRHEALEVTQEEHAMRADISQSLASQVEWVVQGPTKTTIGRFILRGINPSSCLPHRVVTRQLALDSCRARSD
jgi:predicted transcriptional regulator